MKYVKLFESFVVKYDLIKDLPIPDDKNTLNYFINTSDIDKIRSIEFALKNSNFTIRTRVIKPNIRSIFWFKDDSEYYYQLWDDEFETETETDIIGVNPTINWCEVNFDEHFKLKHEFRGHNLKKFGV